MIKIESSRHLKLEKATARSYLVALAETREILSGPVSESSKPPIIASYRLFSSLANLLKRILKLTGIRRLPEV